MALRKNSLALAALALGLAAAPALAEDYIYNYGSHSDSIALGAGDAPRANIVIQHPTPWPSYVNDTNFNTPARQGISTLEQMFKRYEGGSKTGPSTVINVGTGAN